MGKEDDVKKFLASGTHLGAQNVDRLMESYVYKRKSDGIHIINLRKTWEKLILAARIIAGIENPADVCVISSRPYGTRAVLNLHKPLEPHPLLADLLLVHLPIKFKRRSVSQDCWLPPTLNLIIKLSLKHPMSIFQSLLCAILILHQNT